MQTQDAPDGLGLEVQVGRSEFSNSLSRLKKSAGTKVPFEIILAFSGGKLSVQGLGMVVEVAASGRASAEVHLDSAPLLKLARLLPAQDPLLVRAAEGELHLGSLSFPCKLFPATARSLLLPVQPDMKDILALRHRLSPGELARSGHLKALEEAEEARDALVKKAAAILTPLGISEADVLALAEERLRQTMETIPEE